MILYNLTVLVDKYLLKFLQVVSSGIVLNSSAYLRILGQSTCVFFIYVCI